MKRILLIALFILFSTGAVKSSDVKEDNFPAILQMAIPIYPPLAIHLGLEERIVASIKIDEKGQVIFVNFDRGDKIFHKVIEASIKQWKFENSPVEERHLSINFVFKLLPYESTTNDSAIFKAPNTIEVFAKRVRILDSTDRKSRN